MSLRRFALPLLCLTLLLQGCVVSRTQIRHADAVVAASTNRTDHCDRADHCAEPSPLLDAAKASIAASTARLPVHTVSLLGESEASLVARLNLIRAAQHSIDVQTYIWDTDDIGNLMLDELVQAARRGVKVRIIADQLASFGDIPTLSELARASPNFKLRLYNPTFHDAHTSPLQWVLGISCCFFKFNQRMHNKVLVVDDSMGITGGRNYENRYFDWDDDFDYVDRDVLVGGPAARAMADSFNLFWKHKRTVPLTHLRDVNRYIIAHPNGPGWPAPVYTHPQRVHRVQEEAEDDDWLESHILDHSIQTGHVEFFSDLPAKTDKPHKHDALEFTQHVMKMVGNAKREVVLQTPYLVMSKRARRIFEKLQTLKPAPRIVVSTNSLASTDAFAVYAMSYKHRKRYLEDFGFEIYEMKPHAPAAVEANAYASATWGQTVAAVPRETRGRSKKSKRHKRSPTRQLTDGGGHSLLGGSGSGSGRRPAPLVSSGRRFGLHAKSIVVDDSFSMVGSHNFDPRSDHYNTEAGVIVYDRRFADQLRASILRDTLPENAWVIAPRHIDVALLSEINSAIGEVSRRLPLFDFWPYRYATSYQIKPGCQPLRVNDPAFLTCYEAVGDFPDVALSPKLIYTRLITAFGVGASGIL
ncbi:MAG: phospholipase D family protein [Rhodanobacter sp.]